MRRAATLLRTWLELLLRRLAPAHGRHRATAMPPGSGADAPTLALPRVGDRRAVALRGEDVALVRPYIVAYEQGWHMSARGFHSVWMGAA